MKVTETICESCKTPVVQRSEHDSKGLVFWFTCACWSTHWNRNKTLAEAAERYIECRNYQVAHNPIEKL